MRGELRRNEPMSRHTSWRVGGPADIWYRPADRDDLADFVSAQDSPLFWLGLGSNLLVRDGGLRGAAVTLYDALTELTRSGGLGVRADAGVHCARVAKFCAGAGLAGAAFFAGIPGTLGGALAMNAGAFGTETWERVRWVEVLETDGRVQRYTPDDFVISYRSVKAPREGGLFRAAELDFAAGDPQAEAQAVKDLLRQRRASQPVGQPSCGSVFRNPPGDHAARLIEAAGLKAHRIGGAQIAEKHANFILNTGEATAADIEALIVFAQATVAEKFAVELQPEVRIIGEVQA